MKNNKQFTLLVLFTGLLVVLLLGCPTEAPKDKDKSGGDDPIDVSAIIQSSLWEDDSKKDCGKDASINVGNIDKYVYIFDTDGNYYSVNFAALENTGACSNTNGWPTTISRSAVITAAVSFFTNTYSVSGNTITLTQKSNLSTITDAMTFSASGGGTITHNDTGTVYTKIDAGSD